MQLFKNFKTKETNIVTTNKQNYIDRYSYDTTNVIIVYNSVSTTMII